MPTFFLIMVVIFVLVAPAAGRPDQRDARHPRHRRGGRRASTPSWASTARSPCSSWLFLEHFLRGDLGNSIILKVPVMAADRGAAAGDPVPDRVRGAARRCVLAVPTGPRQRAQARFACSTTPSAPASRSAFPCRSSIIGILLLTVPRRQAALVPGRRLSATPSCDNLYHLFLPALTLALSLSAVLMRNLRSSIIDVLDAEYVDFARAKGLRNRLVLSRHVLRNALISTVTLFGLNIGYAARRRGHHRNRVRDSRRRPADDRFDLRPRLPGACRA